MPTNSYSQNLDKFKEVAVKKYAKIKLLQFSNPSNDFSVDVEQIFVDLHCEQFKFKVGNNEKNEEGEHKQQAYSCLETINYKNLEANEDKKNVVILGLPGAGKSTLLKQLFKGYCDIPDVIPIYVELKQEAKRGGFAQLWNKGESVKSDDLDAYIKQYLDKLSVVDVENFLNYTRNNNFKFVFFCDGLDEISKEQYKDFADTVRVLSEFDRVRFVISSRQVGFSINDYSEGFQLFSLLDFDSEKQKEFISKYFNIISADNADIVELKTQKEKLLNLLDKRYIQQMAKSPILLSLLCVTPDIDKIKNKAQLFEKAIEVLLRNRNIAMDSQRLFVSFLKEIAVIFFKLDKAENFEEEELVFYANKYFNIDEKEMYLNCGLFDKIDSESKTSYKFVHRTIWEYLVAEGMIGRENEIYSRANMDIWEEPIKMWASLVVQKTNLARNTIFKELWKRNKALTLTCMNEIDPFPINEFNELYNNLTKRDKLRLIATLRDSYVNPSSDYRKQAINTIEETLTLIHSVERDCEVIYTYLEFLEEFKEERTFNKLLRIFLDYDHLNERRARMAECGLDFSEIPAGLFNMGRNQHNYDTDEEKNKHINVDSEEMPAHKVRITKPFKISKTLVTNKMFYDSGFPYLNKNNNDILVFKGNSYSQEANQPVNYVNWYEAMVFAKWLGYSLASEAEWEYACRGGSNNDYMTDNLEEIIKLLDDTAYYASRNPNIGHPNKTRAVIPYDISKANSVGLVDMLGNLREWCLDWYSDDFYKKCDINSGYYPNFNVDIIGKPSVTYYFDENGQAKIAKEIGQHKEDLFTFDANGYCVDPIKRVPGKFESKCLRGGCFDWNESNLRPTYRNHNPANNVYKVNGFRLVNKEN